MNLPDHFTHRRPLIEPLEQRIAPALLINGGNLLGGGGGNPTTGQTSIGGNSVTLVKVLSGTAIVWFDHGSIDAISVGPNTSLDITGNVPYIIGNLTASGKLSDSDGNPANGLDGDVLLPNNITGITTHPLGPELGSIGDIITGGAISNLNISGNLIGAYAGNGVFRTQSVFGGGSVTVQTGLDLNPIAAGIQNSFVFSPSNAKTVASGAPIMNAIIGGAEEMQMFAGSGFAGTAAVAGHPAVVAQPGGSISNITIKTAFIDVGLAATVPSYSILAGAGGSGPKGAAGGSIQNVTEIASSGVVDIIAGQGGNGSSGPGGAGGSIKTLNMESDSTAYTIHAGKGGSGAPGGAGGVVSGVNFGGDALSKGIIVSARFTGGSANDILLVDSLTGSMVIEQNDGDGSGFTPVIQDSVTLQNTIAPLGETPVSAVAVDVNGDGLPDIVVAYKNTDNLGVFTNQGGGVFYTENFTGGSYTGNTLDGTSVPLPYAPILVAAGNFTGDSSQDLAVLTNNLGTTELLTLPGNGKGGFSVPTAMLALPAEPVGELAANLQNGSFSDLVVGFKTGQIDSLLSNGATTGVPFTLANSGVIVSGGILNLDYDATAGVLLALNGTGSTISLYAAGGLGALTPITSISLTPEPGTPLVAHFVPTQSGVDPIEVLSSISSGSRLDVYSVQGGDYVLTSSTQSTETLTNFVPVVEGVSSGVAAVGTSLGHFAFSQNGGPFYDVGLPFSGKSVAIVAGDGGNGLLGSAAKGGAGGYVSGMSILAGQINIQAGNGGAGDDAAGGAGGAITDTPTLLSGGQSVSTILEADSVLAITAGAGGSASGTVHAASGGVGGKIQGLNLSLLAGDVTLNAGDGGSGGGGAGGSGGLVTAIKSIAYAGDLDITAGTGGSALGSAGNGGAGGSITNVTHTLTLTDQTIEAAYGVSLAAGGGGGSVAATGGAGGSVQNVNMTLQPSNESVSNPNATIPTNHTPADSTLRVIVTAGDGGDGATGGTGGSIKTISSTSVYEQIVTIVGASAADTYSFPEINPVAAQIVAGNGGAGSKAGGGAGGSISGLTLTGISHYDPDPDDTNAGQSPLLIMSGNGGDGATTGGAGGSIAGIIAQNAQFGVSSSSSSTSGNTTTTTTSVTLLSGTELSGATVISGHGGNGAKGNGGVGGTIANLQIGVSGFDQAGVVTVSGNDIFSGGEMTIQSGAGGSGGTSGKGGAAGSIINSILGSADAFEHYGVLVQTGDGGSGSLAGGLGGNITKIQLNAPANASQGSDAGITTYDVLASLFVAGNGGAATGSNAVGGAGGSIGKIVESKDVDTSIDVLQAGNGGNAVKTGGIGGSVTAVDTVGLIGQPSDASGNSFGVFQSFVVQGAFDSLFPAGVPQGVFAGRGGTGATAGADGSVSSISAAAIAAIGAAEDSNGLFAAASKISNITAEVIGYDQNGNGHYDNVSGVLTDTPAVSEPIDGFIFSDTALTGINVPSGGILTGSEFAP